MNEQYKNMIIFTLLSAVAILLPGDAAAALGDPNTGFATVTDALCQLEDIAKGNAGKAIATAAIIFVGVAAFFGKANWGLVVLTIVGIGAIFGAGAIAGLFAGGGACT